MIKIITIINEKSSQTNNFAKALGGVSGTLFDNSTLGGQQYQLVYAAGHLLEFKDLKDMVPKDEADNFTSWDYNNLPFDRTKINWQKQLNPHTLGKGASTYMANFKRALANSDAAVIATDNDPSGEGDMIGWEILDYCNFNGDVYRCKHEDESVKGVRDAFEHLVKVTPQDGLLKKAEARQKFDFLTIQYVRVMTDEAAKKHVLPNKSIIKGGRLQSAMVSLIGTSQVKHEHFKPHSDYQPILVDLDGHKFVKKDAEFYQTNSEAQEHLGDVPQNSVSEEKDVKKLVQRPPKLLDLSTVASRMASNNSTKEVEDMAEKLYQDHILSYPRTEDTVITPEQLDELKPLLPKICQAIGVDYAVIDPDSFRSYLIGSGSHGANRPGTTVPKSLDELRDTYGETAAELYDNLARSFLAGFCPDKKLERHTYCDSETHEYEAHATVTTDPGWEIVFKMQKDHDKDEESTKLFKVCQELKPDVWEKKATRPSLATMAKLMSYLKARNIGTGATRLGTYNNITNAKLPTRRTVISKKGKLTLSKLGFISYLLMQKTALAAPDMTKRLDGYLNEVAKDKITEAQLLAFFDKLFDNDMTIMLNNQKLLDNLEKVKTTSHHKVSGIFKPTGEKVSFSDGYGKYTFTQNDIDTLLKGETIRFIYNENSYVEGKLADREKYGFGFSGKFIYKDKPKAKGVLKETGKEIEFNKEFSGHTFTDDEIRNLLNGEVVVFNAKSKKNGKKYTARVKLIYDVPFGSKTNTKTWHIGFDKSKKAKK